MPGDNGVVLLEYLRKNYPDIIRLLTTAYSDIKDAINSVNNGEIFRYIQKPWDYDSLKIELSQAISIFETTKERDQLINEKIIIKKKLHKINRIKSLILLSRSIQAIRFSDYAIDSFISDFINENIEHNYNLESLELGNDDLLETLFLINIVDNICKNINNINDYKFNKAIEKESLIDKLKNISTNINAPILINIPDNIENININESSFDQIIHIMLNELNQLSNSTIAINIEQSNQEILISVKAAINNNSWPQQNNILNSSPNNKSELYTNILTCYLFAAHHGGRIEFTKNNNDICFKIKLPNQPDSINTKNIKKFCNKNYLDQVILSSMI